MRAVFLACLVAVAAAAPAAHAYVAPGATIVSASLERLEQADDTTLSVAISGDGRYVAFHTRARNFFADDDPDPPGRYRHGGIFRRDLQTGALELVAHGDVREEEGDALVSRGAANPSLSADGRYVAFSTAAPLVAADHNGAVDVYVRDMALPPTAPGAYDLVSALDASSTPATYPVAEPGRDPGAEVTAAAAISADGQRVVFRTPAASDLTGLATPAQQLFLRDRAARTTRLLTRDRTTGDPAGGADAAAVISADGSTVVWVGRNGYRIAERLPNEPFDDQTRAYLWQRVGDGPTEVRRVTGAVDLDDPECDHNAPFTPSPTATGHCYGLLTDGENGSLGLAFSVPAVNGDGWQVAFLTSTSVRPLLFGSAYDLFVTDMHPGRSRKAATVELTREGTGTAAGASIGAVAMSSDGRWLAISTQRTQFTLPALHLTGAARAAPDRRELYFVDLEARSLERAVRSAGGGDVDGDLLAPALSADGHRLAFVSPATGLFFGDANGRPDAFVVTREDAPPPEPPPPPPEPTPPSVRDPDPEPPAKRQLKVSVRPAPDSRIRLLVTAPSAGRLAVVVRGRVPGAGRKVRQLGQGTRRVGRAGRVSVTVWLKKQHRAALRRAGRLEAQATATLRPASGAPYERRLGVVFKKSG
ncbi:MAG TPA: hypothetical protein VK631_06385 [Solirubrobacteraceae bacterium]|nr:hypothetical protein [Solirubrobacteraceae bacterium]